MSATSIYFESLPYRVHPETGLIDYDQLETNAALFKPAMIIGGGSAYPRDWDYARLRQIADANGALLMIDMAHISGLVATQEVGAAGRAWHVCMHACIHRQCSDLGLDISPPTLLTKNQPRLTTRSSTRTW